MRLKRGDKIRLREMPSKTGVYIRDSRTVNFECLVVWDRTHLTEFVSIGDIERVEEQEN